METAVKESTNSTTEQPPQYAWVSKKRNYDEEARKYITTTQPVHPSQHPLKPFIESVSTTTTKDNNQLKSASSNVVVLDPLNESSASLNALDPLSKMVADVSFKEKQELLRQNEIKSSFEPWSFKKSAILAKYTTVEKLTITSSFLTPMAGAVKDKVQQQKNLTTVSDKIKDRLEQLDQFDYDNMQEMANLSQQDYIKRIDELNNALLNAWSEDDRVKSLKIVIQCAKLLADTSVIQFYPSKFVLITDILDTFGKLVYERIKSKSTYLAPGSSKQQPLPEKFTPDIVPATAKETCRNWFFKIASIRELLPRIYVEASIMKCNNFLSDETMSRPINRLVAMTSGVGDPLVSSYASAYICRIGNAIDPMIREYQNLSLDNLLFTFRHHVSNERIKKLLANQKCNYKTYVELYCPPIDWILQCVSHGRSAPDLNDLLEKCTKVSNENHIVNGLLINAIMSSFEPNFISSMAPRIVEMIKECEEDYFPKYLLFRNLGMCLVFNDAAQNAAKETKGKNKQDLQLLNDVWKIVTKLTEPANYMSCAEIWIEFTLKNFTKKEINTLLGDIIRHMQPDRTFESFYPQLQSIVSKTLVYVTDFSVLFAMDKFLQFLSLFQKESVKLEVCKSVTYAFLRSNVDSYRNDIVVVNSMLQICKSMHDYVNALTLEDEIREIANMLCSFVNKVDEISGGEEKDKIEQHLNFYSEARASFSNLDPVIALLVHKVNTLAMVTLKLVDCNHTRKTAPFVRACVAYSFITIPSLSNPMLKLQLYLESAQVALHNQCLSQADAFVKSALSLIPEAQKQIELTHATNLSAQQLNFDNTSASKIQSSLAQMTSVERFLNEYLSNIMSTLLLIPDNPEQSVLYLLTGVHNIIDKHFNWDNKEIKFNLLLNLLVILGSLKQETYLHHIENVESNDTLYGSDPKYLKEINKTVAVILDDMLELLTTLSPTKQSQLALNFFNKLISHADLSNGQTLKLAINMWNLSLKHQQSTKLHDHIISSVKLRAEKQDEYKSLLEKILAK